MRPRGCGLQPLEGLQSEFGGFLVNRKTNSWRTLWSLCLSQGCYIRFPTWKAPRPRGCFVSSGPPFPISESPPISGNHGTSAQGVARQWTVPTVSDSPRAGWGSQGWKLQACFGKKPPYGLGRKFAEILTETAMQDTQWCLNYSTV